MSWSPIENLNWFFFFVLLLFKPFVFYPFPYAGDVVLCVTLRVEWSFFVYFFLPFPFSWRRLFFHHKSRRRCSFARSHTSALYSYRAVLMQFVVYHPVAIGTKRLMLRSYGRIDDGYCGCGELWKLRAARMAHARISTTPWPAIKMSCIVFLVENICYAVVLLMIMVMMMTINTGRCYRLSLLVAISTLSPGTSGSMW